MRTSGGEQKECSRYLWKDLSQVQEQKRYVANLAVLGTVDMLEDVSGPPFVRDQTYSNPGWRGSGSGH